MTLLGGRNLSSALAIPHQFVSTRSIVSGDKKIHDQTLVVATSPVLSEAVNDFTSLKEVVDRLIQQLSTAERICFISSAAVYGSGSSDEIPFRTDSPRIGTSLYALEKIMIEDELVDLASRNSAEVLILRPSGFFGCARTELRRGNFLDKLHNSLAYETPAVFDIETLGLQMRDFCYFPMFKNYIQRWIAGTRIVSGVNCINVTSTSGYRIRDICSYAAHISPKITFNYGDISNDFIHSVLESDSRFYTDKIDVFDYLNMVPGS